MKKYKGWTYRPHLDLHGTPPLPDLRLRSPKTEQDTKWSRPDRDPTFRGHGKGEEGGSSSPQRREDVKDLGSLIIGPVGTPTLSITT